MRTHRFDVLSFVFGALFVGIAVVALVDSLVITAADWRWLSPSLLVLIGLVLVLSAARRVRPSEAPAAPYPAPVAEVTNAGPDAAAGPDAPSDAPLTTSDAPPATSDDLHATSDDPQAASDDEPR